MRLCIVYNILGEPGSLFPHNFLIEKINVCHRNSNIPSCCPSIIFRLRVLKKTCVSMVYMYVAMWRIRVCCQWSLSKLNHSSPSHLKMQIAEVLNQQLLFHNIINASVNLNIIILMSIYYYSTCSKQYTLVSTVL